MSPRPAIRRPALTAAAGVAVLVLAAYGHALGGPFVFDDLPNIVDNAALRIPGLAPAGLAAAAFDGPLATRPVAYLSFALNHLAGGYEVAGFRAVNLAVHALNGILVFVLAGQTLRAAGRGEAGEDWEVPAAALAAAWIFVAHPVQTQAVSYVVQRMTSLGATFYLASLVLYLAGRRRSGGARRGLWVAGLVTGLLALGTKENTATLPVVVLAYEWCFFRAPGRGNARRAWLAALAVLPLAVLGLAYLGPDPWQRIAEGYAGRDFTPGERLLTEARVLWLYLRLVLLPLPSELNLIHDVAVSRSLLDPPTTALAVAGLAGLALAAWGLARRLPSVSFGIAWFLAHLVIESTVIPLELAYEHRLYLPMFGVALIAGRALAALAGPRPAAALAAAAVVAALLAAGAHVRNRVWTDEVTLWSDVAAKSPGSHRAHYNLGNALARRGDRAAAIDRYRRAIAVRPAYHEAHNNLGAALVDGGRLAEGIAHYERALAVHPGYPEAHNNLGRALAARGERRRAEAHYREALRLDPGHATAHYNLGNLLWRSGDEAAAMARFREAARLDPGLARAHNNLGVLLAQRGRTAEAAARFAEAVAADPAWRDARVNLARALRLAGKIDAACAEVRTLLRGGAARSALDPGLARDCLGDD